MMSSSAKKTDMESLKRTNSLNMLPNSHKSTIKRSANVRFQNMNPQANRRIDQQIKDLIAYCDDKHTELDGLIKSKQELGGTEHELENIQS